MLPDFEFRPNGDGTEPVYRFRRPSVAERNFAFKRAIRAKGGVYHSEFDLLAALEKGVAALTDAGPGRDRHLAAVAEYRKALAAALEQRRARADAAETVLPEKTPGEMTEAEAAERSAQAAALLAEAAGLVAAAEGVQEIAEAVRRGYPRFAALEADRAAFFAIRGLVAVELFGIGLDPEALPPEHVEAIGAWCEALFQPGAAQRKNSSSPSPQPATAPSSTSSSPSVH